MGHCVISLNIECMTCHFHYCNLVVNSLISTVMDIVMPYLLNFSRNNQALDVFARFTATAHASIKNQ